MPDLFGERMARTANDKLTTADGSSKPQGIAQGAANGKTAASISAIAPDELIDLQHSVNPAYRASPKAAFMFNDATLAVLRKLKDSENRYIWQAPNLQTGEPGSLLGNRYWINPSMANIGANARSIIFGDLSKYVVRRVGNFTIFVFRERYMNNLQLGFMAFGRFDGKVVNTAAIKRLTHPAA
jgi:HK97 family phage major capsid protein